MLANNESVVYNPQSHSYDYSSCFELSIADWIELYNLQLDYPVISYDAKTIEEAIAPKPVIVPPTNSSKKSKVVPIALCAVGGVALTVTAVIVAKSRMKSKFLKAVM